MPFTSSLLPGLVVPIPTLPLESIRIASTFDVLNVMGSALTTARRTTLPVLTISNISVPAVTRATAVDASYTSNFELGVAVPIPTLPLESIRIRSALLFTS